MAYTLATLGSVAAYRFALAPMKSNLPLLACAIWLPIAVSLAQDNKPENKPPVEDWKPISYVAPGQQYPELNSENRAKFRIDAPNAKEVARQSRSAAHRHEG